MNGGYLLSSDDLIGHFHAAGKLLNEADKVDSRFWVCPPTRMDAHTLMEEGYYNIYSKVGARTEMPGCSLCMGNKARVELGATVISTSTRYVPNRLDDGANIYLASAELASIGGTLDKLPTPKEYMKYASQIDFIFEDIYRYMNFDQIEPFQKGADEGKRIAATEIVNVGQADLTLIFKQLE